MIRDRAPTTLPLTGPHQTTDSLPIHLEERTQ